MESDVARLTEKEPVARLTLQERLWRQFSRFGPVIMLLAVVAALSIARL